MAKVKRSSGDGDKTGKRSQDPHVRKIFVPNNRLNPLKKEWRNLLDVLVVRLLLECRMNLRKKTVELRSSSAQKDVTVLDKAVDFVKAFILGFAIPDALAVISLDLYCESFAIKDVKPLQGDHLSRAIGRVSGRDGQTKHAIENSTRTRIAIQDTKIHIIGNTENIRAARASLCALILGKPNCKVYNSLRSVNARLVEG